MGVRVIVNPQAADGRAAAKAEEVIRLLRAAGARATAAKSSQPGHATVLARSAIEQGVCSLLVVGGDGTLNEVCQAYLDRDGKPVAGPELGLIPAGTGNDFGRSLNLPSSTRSAVERFLDAESRPIDLGVVQLADDRGQSVAHPFVNVASCGISGLVASMTSQHGKWLSGKLTFYAAAVRATLGHGNVSVQLTVDGKLLHQGRVHSIAFANGRYFGGGMKIAPTAALDDGRLSCVVVGDIGKLEAMTLTRQIYKGSHVKRPKVKSFSGQTFTVNPWRSDRDIWVEVDGEPIGKLPMGVRVHRHALRFRA